MKANPPSLIVLTRKDSHKCVVNLSQVEVIDTRWQAAEITFASGTTLMVSETMETILGLAEGRRRTKRRGFQPNKRSGL